MANDTIRTVREMLEYAPSEGVRIAPNILGNVTEDGHFLCRICLGRIIARGCRLPVKASPLWDHDLSIAHLPCIGCTPDDASVAAMAYDAGDDDWEPDTGLLAPQP